MTDKLDELTQKEVEQDIREFGALADAVTKEIAKGDGSEAELEATMMGIELFVEKMQQVHSECKKQLEQIREEKK
jgi:septation ring formation regulator EzrA